MARGIDIVKYRGVKVHPNKKVVFHVTDKKGGKFHIRFPWEIWEEMINDWSSPLLIKTEGASGVTALGNGVE